MGVCQRHLVQLFAIRFPIPNSRNKIHCVLGITAKWEKVLVADLAKLINNEDDSFVIDAQQITWHLF
jgi:hypothetical protein